MKKIKAYNQQYKPINLDYDEETGTLQEEESTGFFDENKDTNQDILLIKYASTQYGEVLLAR